MKKDLRYISAKKISHLAGKLCLENSEKTQIIHPKEANSHEVVCETDIKVNRLIITHIQKKFPNDKIISEESENIIGNSEYSWIIDPIDGTNNFIRGIPNYCTAIACIFNGQPLFSTIYAPALNIFAKSYLNQGTYINNKKVCVSTNKTLQTSFVAFDLGHKNRGQNIVKPISNMINKCKYMFCYGSYSVSMLYLAMGKIDGYIHNNTCGIWDVLPGGIMVKEAGGIISDIKGKDINVNSRLFPGSIISNGYIHKEIISNIN